MVFVQWNRGSLRLVCGLCNSEPSGNCFYVHVVMFLPFFVLQLHLLFERLIVVQVNGAKNKFWTAHGLP